jgi:putative ABC transport system permease protein
MEQVMLDSTAQTNFNLLLLGVFAAIALLLAVVGIYGVMSWNVGQRTHEIGLRMALGASREDMLGLVVGQGLKLTLVGLGIGVAGALGLTRFLASLLYGVKPTDPLTLITVSIVLTATALFACYVPGRRAATVDPVVALRYK